MDLTSLKVLSQHFLEKTEETTTNFRQDVCLYISLRHPLDVTELNPQTAPFDLDVDGKNVIALFLGKQGGKVWT
jgi:hypothetical protein